MNILIAGDYCPKERIADLIQREDYESIFGQIRPIVSKCDFSLVNFECPVGLPNNRSIKKNGPSLNCTPKAVEALRFVGFKCATLANNHFYDQGEDGVKETINTLDRYGIYRVGGGRNIEEASKTLYVEVNNQRLAIINCCEHEFSIATETSGGSNPLNPVLQYKAIKEAKENADFVVVIVHGGIEHFQYPSHRMMETYRFFIDVGADAVINHHQHCICGYEVYQNKPIFYGLGNFCFDWSDRNTLLWEEGIMVMLSLNHNGVGFQLFPYSQNGKTPGIHLKEGLDFVDWEERFEMLSRVINDNDLLSKKYLALLDETERNYSSCLTPYVSRIALGLYRRHMLPMLLPKVKRRMILNMVMCESHCERFIKMLRHYSE